MIAIVAPSWRRPAIAVALALLAVAAASPDEAEPLLTPCGPVATGGTLEADDRSLALASLAAVVRGVEPSLPRVRSVATAADGAPSETIDALAADAARFLAERGLVDALPDPSELDAAAWQALLDAVLDRYAAPRFGARGHDDDRLGDVEALAARLRAVVRPVALFAWDPDDDARIAFVGLVLNWSPYPRLVVMRPPAGWTMREGAATLAARLDLCGVRVRDWVSAPEPVARALFLRHANDAPMYVVGSDPERAGWPYRVDRGDEIDVFAFTHPEVVDLERFSAVFAAAPLGPLEVARLVPQVRTNLSPVGLLRAFQTPPRRDD